MMSIMYCEIHDKRWDSDFYESCRQCQIEEGDRPQDDALDGYGWTYKNCEHGGKYPDTMPQAIIATDPNGKSWVYVAKDRPERGGD